MLFFKSYVIIIVMLERNEGFDMGVSYNKLWKLLIDKKIKKMELCRMCGISPTTIAKMGNDGDVRVYILDKICTELNCDFSDIMEHTKNSKNED